MFPSIDPITKETPPYASFSQSIEDALLDPGKKQFYTKGDVVSVRSSIPDVIADSADKAKKAQKSAEAAKVWTIIGALGVLVSLAAVVISVYSLVSGTDARYDSMVQEINNCKQQICTLTKQLDNTKEQLKQYGIDLPQELEDGITTTICDDVDSPPSSTGTAE